MDSWIEKLLPLVNTGDMALAQSRFSRTPVAVHRRKRLLNGRLLGEYSPDSNIHVAGADLAAGNYDPYYQDFGGHDVDSPRRTIRHEDTHAIMSPLLMPEGHYDPTVSVLMERLADLDPHLNDKANSVVSKYGYEWLKGEPAPMLDEVTARMAAIPTKRNINSVYAVMRGLNPAVKRDAAKTKQLEKIKRLMKSVAPTYLTDTFSMQDQFDNLLGALSSNVNPVGYGSLLRQR